jgi:hypothetical protein
MVTRRRFQPVAKALQFSGGENRLASGRRPEPQARAEKLLWGGDYLRNEFKGLRGDCRKRSEWFDSGRRMC